MRSSKIYRIYSLVAVISLWLPSLRAETIEQTFVIGTKDLNPDLKGARTSVVVNGQWPGPAIYAQEGDQLVIHVHNNQSLPLTLHWHGIHQHGAQWADGVPGITQCPITFGKSYTYRFTISGQWGTFWYHAHVNNLRNTLHGAVIVRPPDSVDVEPYPAQVIGEHLFLTGDWFHESPASLTSDILGLPYKGFPLPNDIHINGRMLQTGPYVASVLPNRWYRVRIINTGLWAQLNFQIQNHTMYLFEAEGGYLRQTPVKSLDIVPGQSFSVLVKTDQKVGSYWVAASPRYDIEKSINHPAVAILRYSGASTSIPNSQLPKGPTQATDPGFGTRQDAVVVRSLYRNSNWLSTSPVDKLFVYEINQNTAGGHTIYSINNVTLGGITKPYLLALYQGDTNAYDLNLLPPLPPAGLATSKGGPCKSGPSAVSLPYGSVVQVVLQNHIPPGGNHPWHLHGYNFYVVAQGAGRFNASAWKSYPYNLVDPPSRNTFLLQQDTWVAVRFRATNPGFWIMHCHMEPHADQGLAFVFLNQGPNGSLSAPPSDYPAC